MTTIRIDAARYEDEEDCLSRAAIDIARERELIGWALGARWENDERDGILLDIPAWAMRANDEVGGADR